MPSGVPLTDGAVHSKLWERANRRGLVRLDQKVLAAELGVNKFTMSRKIKALVESGRISKVSNKGNGNARGLFKVADPQIYDWVGDDEDWDEEP